MEEYSAWLLWIIPAILVILVIDLWLKNRGLPPGPWGFPVLGYYPFLMSNNHVKLAELAKKYGEIYCFRSLGGNLFVILHGLPIVKEVFVNRADEFGGRPQEHVFLNWAEDAESLTNVEGDVWKEQRRFFLSAAKNYGFGKLEHETVIHECLQNMMREMRTYGDKPFDLHSLISNATCNMMSEILCKKRFAKDDPKYLAIRNNIRQMLSLFMDHLFFVCGFAFDCYMRFTPTGRRVCKVKDNLYAFADEIIEEHEKTLDPQHTRDYIDSYLVHLKSLEKEGKLQGSSFSRHRLSSMFFTMFIEGMETVGVSLFVILLKLSEHEDVQKKLQEEIDEVVGSERMPTWTDKPKMPYMEAVLLELFRTTWPFVISTYYQNYEETSIRGYRIPKRTNIIFNMWEISNNPENFPEPSKFDPNRFLGPEAVNWREKGPIPFGIGKRSCPGEAMGQVIVFITVGALMQNFTLYSAGNGEVRANPREKGISDS